MSDAATDPAKALREFAEARAAVRDRIDSILAKEEAVRYRDCGENSKTVALARAVLSAAPTLLARIEAGERAIGGARCWVASAASHDEDARKDLASIDAFLAGKGKSGEGRANAG